MLMTVVLPVPFGARMPSELPNSTRNEARSRITLRCLPVQKDLLTLLNSSMLCAPAPLVCLSVLSRLWLTMDFSRPFWRHYVGTGSAESNANRHACTLMQRLRNGEMPLFCALPLENGQSGRWVSRATRTADDSATWHVLPMAAAGRRPFFDGRQSGSQFTSDRPRRRRYIGKLESSYQVSANCLCAKGLLRID